MERVTKPCKPDNERLIFTEGIDYFSAGERSIWGSGDKETLEFLRKEKIKGKWLNLAAGDGRYNMDLLKKADSVVACDIDESALSKLWHTTPEAYKSKLRIMAFNITNPFPIDSASFDGIFCAGALHLFPRHVFAKIFSEMDRVLKPGGKIIIDFATDIVRQVPDGRMITFGKEPRYTLDEARKLLMKAFGNYNVRLIELQVFEEEFKTTVTRYKFSCRGFLLAAERKQHSS